MKNLAALGSGLIFGVGLAYSGMANPAKVIGFLNVFGEWDPTLGLVMLGAVVVAGVAFDQARRMDHPWTADRFQFPTRREIDLNLIGGSILFGIGWGLVGLCPGPAIANLARGSREVWIFVAFMAAGMLLQSLSARRIEGLTQARESTEDTT